MEGTEPREKGVESSIEDQQPLEAAGELIAGIDADARAESERLLKEAHKAARERVEAAEAQSERLLEEARTKSEAQAENVRARMRSSMRMEQKRATLKVREEALRGVLQAARNRLAALAAPRRSSKGADTDPPGGGEAPGADYRQILLGWIVEAAIGINVPEAEVNVSQEERRVLDDKLLREAERTVKELTGRKVTLKAAEGNPLVGQGVVLRSADGRLEFNNQVSTRLLRLQSEIRKIVFEALDR
jgi:vacuolar-type H+-ATPase subunit E/Vma4